MTKMAGGFIVFGLQTLILKPDEVQSVLWTLLKRFFYMLSKWCLGFGWNLAKSRFWPHFPYHFYVQTASCLWKYNSRLQKASKTRVSLEVFFINEVCSLFFSKDWIDMFGELLRKNTHNGNVVIHYTTVYT